MSARSAWISAIGLALTAGAAGGLACDVPRETATPVAQQPPPETEAPLIHTEHLVLWFEEYDEVMTGTVRSFGLFSGGSLDLINTRADVRCVGTANARIVPPEASPPERCDGIQGVLELTCSNGRELNGRWAAEATCGSGDGTGQDESSRVFRLAIGGSVERAQAIAHEAQLEVGDKPQLPAPGATTQTADAGFTNGTAFFVSWEGELLTNYHVVGNARRVQIRLNREEFQDVEVVAVDEENDLALLRIEAIRTPLALQSPARIERGQRVFTLGYPLVQLQGQEQKATFGRVNALSGPQGDERFTQVDVPIQPGNSGGPLLDADGNVVGVMSSMLHPTVTMEAAGVVPQNVNYALKSEHATPLLTRELGEDAGPPLREHRKRELTDLVDDVSDSVVLVLAW